MKLWKVLLPLLVLGCSLWCSCPVLAAESPAETLAEESKKTSDTETKIRIAAEIDRIAETIISIDDD